MKRVPNISVVMSIHNGARYLAQSIESILQQTYRDFEFIIVNDGANDKTLSIFKGCARMDKRIVIIHNKKNIGLSRSLNKAILVARGKFIARMDADDISHPERFEKQIHFLKKHRGYHIVGSQCRVIDHEGKPIRFIKKPLSDRQMREKLPYGPTFVHSAVMCTKECIMQVGLYNEHFIYAQDLELWCRILLFYKGANLPQMLHSWRETKEGISETKRIQQKIFGDSVRGRYHKLYCILRLKISPSQKNEMFYTSLLLDFLGLNKRIYHCLLNNFVDARINIDKKILFMRLLNRKIPYEFDSVLVMLLNKKRKSIYERYEMGSLFQRMNRYDDARRIFERIQNFSKKDIKGGAYFHLGEIMFRKGYQDKAKHCFEQCLKIIPNHEFAYKYLQTLS